MVDVCVGVAKWLAAVVEDSTAGAEVKVHLQVAGDLQK